MRTKTTTKEVLEEFALELPTELKIQPKWVIELPAKHKAYIYDVELEKRSGDSMIPVPGFRLVVKNRNNRTPRDMYYGRHGGETFYTELDLKLFLEELVVHFTPKKRTTRQSEDFEEE